MSTEPLPKEFEKTTEVLPFTKYGLATYEEFRKVEDDIQHQEWLRKVGLSNEEIKLYQDNVAGLLEQRKKIECNVLEGKLQNIYSKIHQYRNEAGSSKQSVEPSTSETSNIFEKLHKKPIKFHPEGHPMNDIQKLEENLFGHLKTDIMPITKRRKILRRLERRKERVMGQQHIIPTVDNPQNKVSKPGSLWDVKEMPASKQRKTTPMIGPMQQPTKYTVKENKIVRLEPICDDRQENNEEIRDVEAQEYRAVDIVMPINDAEEELLEGTKMSIDDIKKIERFQDYEPGVPSKILYLKNIATAVSQEQISLLFNQFLLENGGPVEVRLMSGRMRGQAFVAFNDEQLAIRALEEVNGTILSGKPVIAQFGRNTNRIQDDNR